MNKARWITQGRGNKWSREEVAFLRKYYKQYPTSWVARQLGRSQYAVRFKASDIGIRKLRVMALDRKSRQAKPKPHRILRPHSVSMALRKEITRIRKQVDNLSALVTRIEQHMGMS